MKYLEIKEMLMHYYELDLNNCHMTHQDWIRELSECITNEKYLDNFLKEYKQYIQMINS